MLLSPLYLQANTCVKDVKLSFNQLPNKAQIIEAAVKKNIGRKRSYQMRLLNRLGIDNHFQGIQKLPGKGNYLVTGSDIKLKRADLFLVNNYKVDKRITLDHWPYWHPGGMQAQAGIVAIPIEEWKKEIVSKIVFYDLSSNKKLSYELDIPNTKSGAVAFARLPDGRALLISYNMSKLDLFFSKSESVEDGFENHPTYTLKGLKSGAQGLGLVPQCDGKLFLMTFHNTGKVPPLFNGKDMALLFELNLKSQSLTLITDRHLDCSGKCNFAAGTGVHVEKGKLSIISVGHFFRKLRKVLYIGEFNSVD